MGTISTILGLHSLLISLFKSWYFFHFFPFFFPYCYISWYSKINVNYYPLSLFLVNYNYVWSSWLYHIVTLNIDVPQNFDFFIFYYSFWDMFIPLFYMLQPILLTEITINFLCYIAMSLIFFLGLNFSHPHTKCQTLSHFFPHNLHGAFTGLIDVVLYIL